MATPKAGPKWRTPQGIATRRAILATAIELAAVVGLDGLTLGSLATALGMSKSGLFAHFGSKEELQLATIDAATEQFFDDVVRPAMAAEPGLGRLNALCDGWLKYDTEEGARTRGNFFAAVTMEFDGRTGPVRDRVVGVMKTWLVALESAIAVARDLGQLEHGVDPAQLAFELNAFEVAANWSRQLFGDSAAAARARTAVDKRIGAVTTRPLARRAAAELVAVPAPRRE